MSLLDTRDYYKPFDNPWMFDYYVLQNQMHWMPESVPLHTDVKDWQELDPKEKNLLTQIFRLFTQSDVDVGAGYVDRYMRIFKKPEARMIAIDLLPIAKSKLNIPVVAIGGITPENGKQLVDNKADFLAIISGIYASTDIINSVKAYKNLFY